jgi:hypothetical protein
MLPDCFVEINDVDIYPQRSNTFQNTRPIGGPFEAYERGSGIRSIDSRFNLHLNTFNNLWYGVKADNTLANHAVNIDNNTFNDCDISIRYSNMNSGQISRNTINVADRWYWPTPIYSVTLPIGIDLENCPQYSVQDNDIIAVSTTSENARWGIVVDECGTLPNRIYRNYFYGFKIAAVQAQGVNAFLDDGLRILCNQFEDDLNDDIKIVGGDIALTQGFCNGTDGSTPARNVFITDVCSNPGFQINNDPANLTIMEYAYHGLTGNTFPPCTTAKVTTIPCSGSSLDFNNDCPSMFNTSGNHWRSLINEANNDISYYYSMFDGGQTQWLLDSLESENLGSDVKDTLLKYSPWISNQVLLTIVEKSENLDFETVQQVLDSNSRLPKSVWSYLHKLDNETTNALIDSLNAVQDRSNPSIASRLWLSHHYSEKVNGLTNLFSIFLTDSVYEEDGLDSVFFYVETEQTFEYQNLKYSIFMNKGEMEDADSVLTVMAGMDVDNDYCSLQALIMDYTVSEGGLYSIALDSILIDSLENLTERHDRTGLLAKNLLGKVLGRSYPNLILDADGDPERLVKADDSGIQGDHIVTEFIVYPNPTTSSFSVVKKDNGTFQNSKLILYDITSRIVKEVSYTGQHDKLEVDVSGLDSGTYFVSLIESDRVIGSLRIVILY